MIISNSSPLILLAKINKLNLLEKMYNKIAIPYEVYNEVVIKGKNENYSDAALVEKDINEFIFVKDLNSESKKEAEKLKKILGSGESEAIALCVQEKARLLLIDNLEPRKIAQIKSIKCRSTPGILLEALKNKTTTFSEYESAIKELSKYAWLSGDIVAHFLDAGYKIKQGEIK
ncbi:hypothetical protein HYW20_07545 [Candidatus Woesearchaeota archaeon]|nr:hypothetical protein [Candidatus Woesearchaeota archaeon]